MIPSRPLAAICVAIAWFAAALPASAAVKDAVFNKEGVWAIDVDKGSCALSRVLDEGSTFLFRANEGGVVFGYFARTAFKRGAAGRMELDSLGVDFKPEYLDEDPVLYTDIEFDPEVVTALREAQTVRILLDGRPVVSMSLAGTGFQEALDGVIACSKGQSGWWGPGATAPPPAS